MRDAQTAAVNVLTCVLSGRNLDQELAAKADYQSPAHSRALVQDICYGVLRHLGLLDAQLARLLAKPLTDDAVRQLMRIALYQLQFTRAAPHAVVDQAVLACTPLRAVAAKGLVNAVLRAFLRRRSELAACANESDTAKYSFPQWWVAKIRARYPGHSDAVLHAGNEHPPLTLRVNTRRGTREAYLTLLSAADIAARAVGTQGVILVKPMPARDIPGLAEGLVSVQDAAAQWAAPLLDAHDGMRVLDACAAPGGKSTHLLECADIALTALDNDARRLERMESNLKRLSMRANVLCGDAAHPQGWWDGQPFDRILADVPCTASGVTRRHPDIKWTRRPSDIGKFTTAQQTIMDALWQMLAAGGKFLYVTCSVFEEENQLQIARFLERHADARELTLPDAPFTPGYPGQILPDTEHDGFFYALLQKT